MLLPELWWSTRLRFYAISHMVETSLLSVIPGRYDVTSDAGTNLNCLVTEARVCVNNMPRVAPKSGTAVSRICDLLIASPAPYHYATEPHRTVSRLFLFNIIMVI